MTVRYDYPDSNYDCFYGVNVWSCKHILIWLDLCINIDVCETLMPPFPNMTFDLDLWPTDLKINREHLLIKDYLPTKFETSGAKPSWVISCTRLRATDIPTDRHTDRPTGATQYAPPFSKGGGGGINMCASLVWRHNTSAAAADVECFNIILIVQINVTQQRHQKILSTTLTNPPTRQEDTLISKYLQQLRLSIIIAWQAISTLQQCDLDIWPLKLEINIQDRSSAGQHDDVQNHAFIPYNIRNTFAHRH